MHAKEHEKNYMRKRKEKREIKIAHIFKINAKRESCTKEFKIRNI
jgi:hypothetical protein